VPPSRWVIGLVRFLLLEEEAFDKNQVVSGRVRRWGRYMLWEGTGVDGPKADVITCSLTTLKLVNRELGSLFVIGHFEGGGRKVTHHGLGKGTVCPAQKHTKRRSVRGGPSKKQVPLLKLVR